jgi:hypothetical protein
VRHASRRRVVYPSQLPQTLANCERRVRTAKNAVAWTVEMCQPVPTRVGLRSISRIERNVAVKFAERERTAFSRALAQLSPVPSHLDRNSDAHDVEGAESGR